MSRRDTASPTPAGEHLVTVLDRSGMATAWVCTCGETFLDPLDVVRHPVGG